MPPLRACCENYSSYYWPRGLPVGLQFQPWTLQLPEYTPASLAEKRVEIILQLLRRNLHAYRTHNLAAAIDKNRLWSVGHAIADQRLAAAIDHAGIGRAVLLKEAQTVAARILHIDAQKDHTLAPHALPLALQQRHFVVTGSAGRAPEVNHHRLTLKGGE